MVSRTQERVRREKEVVAAPAKPPRKRISISRILTHLVLGLGAFLALAPFVWMICTSLMTQGQALSGRLIPSEVHLENYAEAWNEAKFALYVRNSAIIAGLTIGGQVVFSTLAAYAFARMEFFGRDFLFILFLSTMMIPEVVILIPNYLTVIWLGRIGPLPWVDNWPALTIPFMASAFSIFLLRQFFAQIPDELWDAARIDGAGHIRFLWQIIVPISRAALMTVIIFTFVGSWNALQWPMIVTNSPAWRPVAYGLSSFIDEAGPELHLQMAGSVITIIPILVLYFLVQKQFTEGIATTGLKG
jgi:ABC-type glycerol-3-phosphate transport system permease component